MPSPSTLEAARKAPDRTARIRRMAEEMQERASADGACQSQHLRAAGFTEAEIRAYADAARALLGNRGRPAEIVAAGRREGAALITQARKIRRRIHGAREMKP